uniref:Uncharacterized protein n=1 Tax=Strigamia maritima TaxID=126957 RepID=T1JGI7_STRMM
MTSRVFFAVIFFSLCIIHCKSDDADSIVQFQFSKQSAAAYLKGVNIAEFLAHILAHSAVNQTNQNMTTFIATPTTPTGPPVSRNPTKKYKLKDNYQPGIKQENES